MNASIVECEPAVRGAGLAVRIAPAFGVIVVDVLRRDLQRGDRDIVVLLNAKESRCSIPIPAINCDWIFGAYLV